jgi:hypothetical protein
MCVLAHEGSCFGPKGSGGSGDVLASQNATWLELCQVEQLFVGVFNLLPKSVVVWRCLHDLPVVEAVQVNGGSEVLGGNAVQTADRVEVVML